MTSSVMLSERPGEQFDRLLARRRPVEGELSGLPLLLLGRPRTLEQIVTRSAA